MTISSSSNKALFNGSGTTGPFPFTFKVFEEADLEVIETDTDDVETTLTLTTDYTVSLNGDQNNNPGGSVTTVATVDSGYKLTVVRVVESLQETDITNGGGFYPEVVENALDRLTMLVQQVDEKVERAVTVPISSELTPTDYLTLLETEADAAAASAVAAGGSATAADASADAAAISEANAAASEANLAAAIGTTVQAYDADTAKLDVDQSWTGAQRGTPTTDNDLSFDLSAANNFTCTPSAGGTLTFTNHTAGQSGFVLLVNGSNYAIAAAATTKISTADLTKISASGTYLISYYDNGTNAYCVASTSIA